jgi:hypothetical protein
MAGVGGDVPREPCPRACGVRIERHAGDILAAGDGVHVRSAGNRARLHDGVGAACDDANRGLGGLAHLSPRRRAQRRVLRSGSSGQGEAGVGVGYPRWRSLRGAARGRDPRLGGHRGELGVRARCDVGGGRLACDPGGARSARRASVWEHRPVGNHRYPGGGRRGRNGLRRGQPPNWTASRALCPLSDHGGPFAGICLSTRRGCRR